MQQLNRHQRPGQVHLGWRRVDDVFFTEKSPRPADHGHNPGTVGFRISAKLASQ